MNKDYDKAHEDFIKEYDRELEEHNRLIPEKTMYWMEKGREILDEEKWEKWDEIVPFRLRDLYRGMELGNCLDIVKILKEGTLEEAKTEIINQNHSGMSYGLVCTMVGVFSARGTEFIEYLKQTN